MLGRGHIIVQPAYLWLPEIHGFQRCFPSFWRAQSIEEVGSKKACGVETNKNTEPETPRQPMHVRNASRLFSESIGILANKRTTYDKNKSHTNTLQANETYLPNA